MQLFLRHDKAVIGSKNEGNVIQRKITKIKLRLPN